jgi:hypothetical protein
MLVVNLLHEFELGVWKAVFAHLLWLLYAQGGNSIQKLNERHGTLIFLDYNHLCLTTHTGIKIFQHSAVIPSRNSSKIFPGCPSLLLMILRIYFR